MSIFTRVLDDGDPDVQAKTLDCLLNSKDECLTPYSQNLKNLIDVKTLREELTTWAVSRDSLSIQKEHRSRVVPLIIRVLTPKVRKLKLLGSRKVGFYLILCTITITVDFIFWLPAYLSFCFIYYCDSIQVLVTERRFFVSFCSLIQVNLTSFSRYF